MSWLKLNDSFNNLKGQITNFAQEVLAESIPEEKDPLERLNDANSKIDELTNLCTTQDIELITLRKQVLECQQQLQHQHQQGIQHQATNNETSSSSKVNQQDVVSNTTEHISDSWFWEPDNNTSSSSSKNENEFISKSPSGGDLTIIPLDNPLNENDLIEKLNKRLDEKEQKLKKFGIENALINEKLKQLFNENRELNCNIDELDKQHNVAIEKIISLKNETQKTCQQLEVENNKLTESLTKIGDENLSLKEKEELNKTKLQQELDKYEVKVNDLTLELQKTIQENHDVTENYCAKVSELEKQINALNVANQELQKNCNTVQKIDISLHEELKNLQKQYDELRLHVAKDDTKNKIVDLDVEKSQILNDFTALQKSNLNLQREYRDIQNKYDELLKKTEDTTEVEQLRIEKRQIEEDFIVLQDDDLDLQREHHALQKKYKELVSKQENDDHLHRENNKIVVETEKLIETLRIEKDQISLELVALQEENIILQRKYFELNDEYNELKKNQSQPINHEIENLVEKLRAEKTELAYELNKLHENHKNLQNDFDLIKSKYDDLSTRQENEVKTISIEKRQIEADFIALQEEDLCHQREYSDLMKKHEILLTQHQKNEVANKEMTKMIEELQIEKQQIQNDFITLQDNDLERQREHQKLENIFEDLLTNQNQELSKADQLQDDYTSLQEENLNLQHEHHALKNKFAELLAMLEKNDLSAKEYQMNIKQLENDKTNLQNKIDENLVLQKQIIDLQSNLNNKSANELDHQESARQIIDYDETKKLIKDYIKYEGEPTDNQRLYFEEFLKMIVEKLNKLEISESKLLALELELDFANEDKKNLLHNKRTLEADIENYESECQDLMSNNTKILIELEQLKNYSKLETIHENSEESVALLEKQLDDCNNLNRNLSDDYRDVKEQLQLNEYDKNAMLDRIRSLENDVTGKRNKCKDLTRRINVLENDLTNLQFELNEYKSDNDNKFTQLINEKETIQKQLNAEIEKTTEYYNEIKQLINNNEKLNENFNAINHTNEQLLKEKTELIKLITIKHDENITYHTEIQRLNQLLHNEIEHSKQQQCATTTAAANITPIACEKCPENFELIKNMQNDAEKMNDQIVFLKEKSDILTNNLLIEQNNQKLLISEKLELLDAKNTLARDLERLRQHLLEIEDAHTQETIDLQRLNDEIKVKLASMEEQTKYNSTAYTSASIRANQHAETLQAQYILLTQQRDELLTKLSVAEDKEQKNQAALINLQCALEQFQRDKERDVDAQTLRLRRAVEEEKLKQINFSKDIKALHEQLNDAKNGLLAAARISDQLEMSQMTIATLKDELIQFNEKYANLEKKYESTANNQADKIDKELIKNLLIGYIITTINNDKIQILKLITSVLDFNVNEIEKVGLNRQGGYTSWLNNILTNNQQQNNDAYNKESLAQAFVQFLEKESQPRNTSGMPTLLNIGDRTIDDGKTTPNNDLLSGAAVNLVGGSTTPITPSSSLNQQQTAVQPILLNENTILPTFNPQRNSSSILKDILNDS